MSFWEKVKLVFIRPAEDVKGGLDGVKDGLKDLGNDLDDALAKKERELAATPAERFDMVLEDVDSSNQRLEDLVAEGEQALAADQHAAAEATDAGTSDDAHAAHPPRTTPVASHQLLEPADVSSSPHLQAAMAWVTVEPTQEADPMCERCGHAAWIDENAVKLVGERELSAVAAEVDGHPLVNEVVLEDVEVFYVGAPTLHHEDVRLLVAAAMAEHLPAGWRTTTPPDLKI